MHILLYKFHQGGKYTTQISSHQAELKIQKKFTDKKPLSISSLQTDFLILTAVQVETIRNIIMFRSNALFVEVPNQQKNVKN